MSQTLTNPETNNSSNKGALISLTVQIIELKVAVKELQATIASDTTALPIQAPMHQYKRYDTSTYQFTKSNHMTKERAKKHGFTKSNGWYKIKSSKV